MPEIWLPVTKMILLHSMQQPIFLEGKINAKGTLPVTVCDNYKYGSGIIPERIMPVATPGSQGLNGLQMTNDIDSIAN